MLKEQRKSSSDFHFFLIPNPNPLLRSSNVPEPVIHPPGLDPCSFLKPKPHGDGGLDTQTLSPLDVDPSAASRSEIITMKINLTASELAGGGGTLSETTTVVATSDSPANSEVVVQQTVVKKFENTQITICDVCNVTCNTKDMFKKHMEGKKHLKNMQKLAVSPAIKQEAQPQVATNAIATLDQESETIKKKDLLQNEPSVDSLFICNVLDLGKYDQNMKIEQPMGEKHATQVPCGPFCSDWLPNPTYVSITPAQPSDNNTLKAQDKPNVRQLVWCEVCKVDCRSDNNFNKHISGKKHLKNLKTLGKKLVPPSSMPIASMAMAPFTRTLENLKPTEHEIGEIVDSEEAKLGWCELCKVSCSSNILGRHLSGKKHMKNLQKSMKLAEPPSNPIASVTTLPVEKPKSTKGEVVNPNEVKSVRCELCGICCNSNEELNKHISGQKHQKNIRKTEKLFKHNPAPAPAAKRSLRNLMNKEGKVVIPERGKRKADRDSSSDEDSYGKRQKVTKEEGEYGAYVTCKCCNVVCTSPAAFTSHLASHEHSAMALKQVKLGSK